jgi:transposase-like protein
MSAPAHHWSRGLAPGAIPEQVAADLGVSRSTLYRELRKHREGATAERVVRKD